MRLALAAACLVTLFSVLRAQTPVSPPSEPAPTLKTTVPLILIPASVADKKGHQLSGLKEQEFLVLDNDQPRRASVDTDDLSTAPVALAVLVQTSDVASSALAKIRKVGAMIPDAVAGAHSSAAVLTYDNEVRVVQPFTQNADAVADAFGRLEKAEAPESRMLDAVSLALRMLSDQGKGERGSILIVGQSRDRGSEAKLEKVLEEAGRSGVTIYALTYSALFTAFTTKASEYQVSNGGSADYLGAIKEAARLGQTNTATALVNATGGKQISFETKGKLENDLIELGRDIHSRYLVAFTPATEQTSSFHSIQIQIRNHPELIVRSRSGYWSIGSR